MLSAISTIKGEAFKAITGSDAAKNAVKVPGMIATETLSFAQLRAAGASNAAAAVITASGVVGKLSGAVMGAIVGAAATGPAAPVAAAILGVAASKIGGDIGTSLGGIIADAFGLPLVVDLDGDGVNLVTLAQSKTFFDMDGDGFREHTGWVGAGDGLLVVDFNHNGQVDDFNEISFARFGAPGATDLEGLAAAFDGHHDGVIDERDARFGELLVWQDANQNGRTDAGELTSLAERAITSIGLDRRSPAVVEPPSAFENFLFGTSTFTRADGSVGAVGDVALGFVNSGLRSEAATGDGVSWLRDESGALIEVITGQITGNIQPPAGDVVGIIGSSAAEQLSIPGTQAILLAGEGGNDSLTGGAGEDWLIGGAGSDKLSGGAGDDVLFIDAEDRQADIDGGDGEDMVIVGGATGVTFDLGAARVEMGKGGEGNDTLLTTGADTIIANGGAGNDTLVGGPGEDILEGGPGADVLVGGAGDDILLIDGQDTVDAGEGTDALIVEDPAGVTLDLGAAHAELAFGGAGDDVLMTSGTTGVLLYGSGGDDQLQGGQGDDALFGGDGNDVLIGGAGDDVLDGGAGDDLAVFTREFAGYELFRSGTSAAVRDTNPADGDDGTDFVSNVERLVFADRVISLEGTDDAPAPAADAAQTGLNTPLTLAPGDAPVARPDGTETTEDVGLTLPPEVLLANDADPNGHTLQIERVDGAGRGTVALNPDGAITYTPAANFHGTDAFTYTVRNSTGATRRATALMRVRATNDAPVAGDDAATTEENHPVTLTAAALLGNDEDVDGDALRVLAVGEAQRGLTRVNPDGSVTYTPGLDFAGIDQFTYRVSDGHGGNATGTVSITVTPADDPPVMTADAAEATAVVAGAAALAMVVAGPMAAAVAMVAAGATATAAATAAVVAGATTAGVPANRETGGPGGPAADANVEDPIVAAAPPEEIADDTRVEQLRQAMAAFAPSESATDMTLPSDLQHQLTPVLAAASQSGHGHT